VLLPPLQPVSSLYVNQRDSAYVRIAEPKGCHPCTHVLDIGTRT
jgi:hypothetical protein